MDKETKMDSLLQEIRKMRKQQKRMADAMELIATKGDKDHPVHHSVEGMFDTNQQIKIHALYRISKANKIINDRLAKPHVPKEWREILIDIQEALYDMYPDKKYQKKSS